MLNYDIPYDTESYVHRIGRTGRAGRSGEAILFIAPRERNLLRLIERATRRIQCGLGKIEELPSGPRRAPPPRSWAAPSPRRGSPRCRARGGRQGGAVHRDRQGGQGFGPGLGR